MEKLSNEVKDIIRAEDTDNSDKVMICFNRIPSTSNIIKNLAVNKRFSSFYIQAEFDDKEETIINIFSEYVEPLLKDINNPVLLQ